MNADNDPRSTSVYKRQCKDAMADKSHYIMANQRAPASLPRFLEGTRDTVLLDLKKWATNPRTAGGGWPIKFDGTIPPNQITNKRGFVTKFRCRYCKWKVLYEDCTTGFLLYSIQGYTGDERSDGSTEGDVGHNHTLEADVASVMAAKGGAGRFIPEDLRELGHKMSLGGASAISIDRVLRANARQDGVTPQWIYNDIYKRFAATSSYDDWDFSALASYLIERERLHGKKFFMDSEKFEVNRVFVELEGALEEWAIGGKSNVLLFDPTYGTNRHGMKLCCFVTISPHGQSVILAMSLIYHEREEDVLWSFKCFHRVFKEAPKVIFTDDGSAIKSALHEICLPGYLWARTRHCLCVFHVSKNVHKHLSRLFSDRTKWRQFFSLFWKIAKETDVHSCTTWTEDWEHLEELLNNCGAKDDALDAGSKWLANLGHLSRHLPVAV